MKVLFLTGYSGFTQRTHNICKILKKLNPNVEFIKYVYGFKNFEYLKKNNELKYQKLIEIDKLLEECENSNLTENEIFLKIKRIKFDLKNINITKMIYAERILTQHTHSTFYRRKFSHIEILKFASLIYENILENLKDVKCVYSYHASSIFSYLLSALCKVKKIDFVVLNHDRITNRWFFSDNNFQTLPDKAIKDYKIGKIDENCENEIEKYVENLEKNIRPEFMIMYIKENLKLLKFSFKNIKNFIQNFFISKKHLMYLQQNNYQRILSKLKLKFNESYSKKYFNKKIPENFKILYFPIQFEPETTTLVTAVDFYDQKAVIKLLSVHLPPNWKMIVKEHPSMIGRRDYNFYKEINELHNIEIIDPYFHSLTMVKNSDATLSLSGTVALESFSLNKPTIVLGNVFYSILNGMFKIEKLSDLNLILTEIEENNVNLDQKKEIIKLISSIEKTPHVKDVEGDFWTRRTYSETELVTDSHIANYLDQKLKN